MAEDSTYRSDATGGAEDTQMHKDAGSDIADAACVTRLYNLFLRRNPEDQTVITENVGITVADLFSRFLRSQEFNDKVLMPLAGGRSLWGP
jgi:hypothetical protein